MLIYVSLLLTFDKLLLFNFVYCKESFELQQQTLLELGISLSIVNHSWSVPYTTVGLTKKKTATTCLKVGQYPICVKICCARAQNLWACTRQGLLLLQHPLDKQYWISTIHNPFCTYNI